MTKKSEKTRRSEILTTIVVGLTIVALILCFAGNLIWGMISVIAALIIGIVSSE